MGTVLMRHPDKPENTVEVQERAYDNIWAKKGWELVSPWSVEIVAIDEEEVAGETVIPDLSEPEEIPPLAAEDPWGDADTDPKETRLPVLEEMSESELRTIAAELGIENADDLTANELRSLIGNTPEFYA